jgi:hypothetical protein
LTQQARRSDGHRPDNQEQQASTEIYLAITIFDHDIDNPSPEIGARNSGQANS